MEANEKKTGGTLKKNPSVLNQWYFKSIKISFSHSDYCNLDWTDRMGIFKFV